MEGAAYRTDVSPPAAVGSSRQAAAVRAGKRPLEARFLPVGNPAAGFRIAGPELPASRAGTSAGLCRLLALLAAQRLV